ncbi:hypothetical protein DMA11_02850 [Marinilabiliaceae bacterium JC017]|nr:hypothetical protein DMA11_02850 [Marinilabiliaceae bacterium JC017]
MKTSDLILWKKTGSTFLMVLAMITLSSGIEAQKDSLNNKKCFIKNEQKPPCKQPLDIKQLKKTETHKDTIKSQKKEKTLQLENVIYPFTFNRII